MHLLSRIERYLKRSGIPPTRFGRECLRDPQFVFDLRRGREPGPEICSRVADYIARHETAEAGSCSAR